MPDRKRTKPRFKSSRKSRLNFVIGTLAKRIKKKNPSYHPSFAFRRKNAIQSAREFPTRKNVSIKYQTRFLHRENDKIFSNCLGGIGKADSENIAVSSVHHDHRFTFDIWLHVRFNRTRSVSRELYGQYDTDQRYRDQDAEPSISKIVSHNQPAYNRMSRTGNGKRRHCGLCAEHTHRTIQVRDFFFYHYDNTSALSAIYWNIFSNK